MDIVAMIGLGAASLSTVSLLPQIARVWKTKSVKDISTGWCGFMFSSVSLWLIYGVMARDIPIVAANFVVVLQSATILTFKARYQQGTGMLAGLTSKLKLKQANNSGAGLESEAESGIPFAL